MTKRFNRNPAIQTSFKLEIPGLEEFNYFVQTSDLPGLSMPGVDTPFRTHSTNVPSNRVQYDPVNMTIIVAEDYSNHTQIRLWMHAFAMGGDPIWSVTKDCNLFVLNTNKIPYLKVVFYKAYPTSIGTLNLQSTVNSAEPVTTQLTLRYQHYDILPVT